MGRFAKTVYSAVMPASVDSIIAYVALGANLGDRARSIAAAVDRLRVNPRIELRKVSSLLENPASGGPPDSPPFLNGVAEIATTLSARDLLDTLLGIERDLGRQRVNKWGPRTIDLDLILYGNQIIDLPGLTIPHPRMHERQFVLAPLVEIAAEGIHPILKQRFGRLLAALPGT
jgi:2-amino-4-hydroxy-6-hydroxymethyldihydropteridine diphosphokinase